MQKQDFSGRKLKTQSDSAPRPCSPLEFNTLEVNSDIFQMICQVSCIHNENPGIHITQHKFLEWRSDVFPIFSCIRSVLEGQKEEKKNLAKTRLSFIIEPFWKQRPAGEGRDNDAKYGCAAAGVFWWDSFFVMETWSHSHVRETVILIQRQYEPVGSKMGRVSFYSNNPTARGLTRGGDKLRGTADRFWSVMRKFLWELSFRLHHLC